MTRQIEQHLVHKPGELARESLDVVKNLAIAMAEANQHFYTLQIEAAQAVFEKNTRQLKSRLKKSGHGVTKLEQWSAFSLGRMQKLAELSGTWIESTSQTISEMNELLRLPFSLSGNLDHEMTEQEAETPEERRVSAKMIVFPERRAAFMAKASSKNTHVTAKKPKTA